MGFGNKGPAAAKAKATGAGGARKSRWGGVPSSSPKEPIIEASKNPQRVKFLSCEVTFNDGTGHESFKTLVEIVESDVHEAGTVVLAGPFIINGKSKKVGEGRVKAMAVAGMGCDADEDFDALFPEGEPIDNALNGVEDADTSFIGREALVLVSRGGAREGGDYFREYEWSAVP
jgi:hypothetical protein